MILDPFLFFLARNVTNMISCEDGVKFLKVGNSKITHHSKIFDYFALHYFEEREPKCSNIKLVLVMPFRWCQCLHRCMKLWHLRPHAGTRRKATSSTISAFVSFSTMFCERGET